MFIDKEVFDRNLLLTQAYCDWQLEQDDKMPVFALRSIVPKYHGRPVFTFEKQHYKKKEWNAINWINDPLKKNLYDDFFQKQLVYKKSCVQSFEDIKPGNGRVLFAQIDETVVDGASESVSDGIIDVNDCPPIDTWFYIAPNNNSRILFAWIPQPFIKFVQDAIDVNCVNCLGWHDYEEVDGRLIEYDEPSYIKVSEPARSNGIIQYLRKLFNR